MNPFYVDENRTKIYIFPFFELISLFFVNLVYFFGDFNKLYLNIFFASCLLITVRTDLQKLLISRFVTIYLVPFIFFLMF